MNAQQQIDDDLSLSKNLIIKKYNLTEYVKLYVYVNSMKLIHYESLTIYIFFFVYF